MLPRPRLLRQRPIFGVRPTESTSSPRRSIPWTPRPPHAPGCSRGPPQRPCPLGGKRRASRPCLRRCAGFLSSSNNPSGGLPNLDGLVNRPPARTPDIVPDGGQFLERSYANQAGSRAYKLYVPSGYRGQALPLVVMLHGCTQSPDDFAAGTRMSLIAEEHACFVAYPAQAASANHGRLLLASGVLVG